MIAIAMLIGITAGQYTPATKGQEAEIKGAVSAELKDADSAIFKGIKRTPSGSFCGWVNAKNSYGGYTGFSVFYGKDGRITFLSPEFTSEKLC